MKAKVKINKNWSQVEQQRFDKGMLDLSLDIHARGSALAPILTGAMVDSGRIKRLGQYLYAIIYGNTEVPYARRQYYEHKSKSEWMQRAADSIMRGDLRKYFK